jgi:hypothetical protein
MILNKVVITLSSALLCACVVTPKKVASYNETCKVATQKFELTVEQTEVFNGIHCSNDDCELDFVGDIASAALTTGVSAIVSGSIAVAGNTLYWLELQGNCPQDVHTKEITEE